MEQARDSKTSISLPGAIDKKQSKQRSKEIEAYLLEEKRKFQLSELEPKILILGSSDSGKSTLLKQLKIMHGGGFNDEERKNARLYIRKGIIDTVDTLIQIASSPELQTKYATLHSFSESYASASQSSAVVQISFPRSIIDLVAEFWAEEPVKELLKNNSNRFPDTITYFLDNSNRCLQDTPLPNNEDMLKVRIVTQSTSDTVFNVSARNIHFIDVSGLVHHRKTWVSYFENVHIILFVISLSGYDQNLVEDASVNRMSDALVLFEQMANHPLLLDKGLILFFNKKDVYEKKVKQIPINKYFPEFQGKVGSASAGVKFFETKFKSQCRNNTGRQLLTHITCCTDSKSMQSSYLALTQARTIPQTQNALMGDVRDSETAVRPTAADIEAYLVKEKKIWDAYMKEPKLLLLGSSDSGKSTLLKQLKILHGGGFGAKEKELSKFRIIAGLFSAVAKLLDLVQEFEYRHIPKKYSELIDFCDVIKSSPGEAVSDRIASSLKAAWNEDIIKELWERGNHGIPDSTMWFVGEQDRILAPYYSPTDQDILNLRTVTQSVSDTIFRIKDEKLHVIDVSGLSHHRSTWISYFDDVNAILFVASLSCYDQTMAEEDGVNRMVDSLVLFEDVVNHKLLEKKFFVLFLNKKDIYETKVKTKHIVDYFPQYKGKKGSVSQGIKYFDAKFRDQNKLEKQIVSHVTCCTDTKIMEVIVDSVLESIISGLLTSEGLVFDTTRAGCLTTSVLRSKEIEAYLAKEKREYEKQQKEPKMLLLGSSDSGKSTLLKQLKILHGGGFTAKEIEVSRSRIFASVVAIFKTLVGKVQHFEDHHLSETYKSFLEDLEAWSRGDKDADKLLELAQKCWNEPVIRNIYETADHRLPDSSKYFVQNLDRILLNNYQPTNQDILNLRTVTQSVSDTVFKIKSQSLHVIDVSGLSHHRSSWISYFDDVKTVIFVASLSSYDQNMVEEPDVNRMVDSLVLFEEMANHKLLESKSFILFLNKKDLYEEKIKTKNIVDYFPNYKGKPGSISQGIAYFDSKFRDKNKIEKCIITHVTCCTDTDIMKVIIDGVLFSIVSGNLQAHGL
ncbi:hypothetical protein HDU91_001792 [Kappamyces sp. JEL0680]|nr:hypothetical protein HDU91_001792 [Kappamyces sp. JEL0680]